MFLVVDVVELVVLDWLLLLLDVDRARGDLLSQAGRVDRVLVLNHLH